MQHILFITLIITASIAHTAEQCSNQPLMLRFENGFELICNKPFLYRFTTLHDLPKTQANAHQFTVTYQKDLDPEMALALTMLITKPIHALAQSNTQGHISNALFDAAQLLGIRAHGKSREQPFLTQFRTAFLQAVIQKDAVTRWCIDAKKTVRATKQVPALEDNQPLSTLRALMYAAQDSELTEKRLLIHETAYSTGLMNTLYTHMYGALCSIIRQRSRSKIHSESASHAYLKTIQTALFASHAWHYYATLHGACTPDTYIDLLYGNADTPNNGTLLPTRHYHMAFHDNVHSPRSEYTVDHEPLMPYEITTNKTGSEELFFKPMQIITDHKTTSHITAFDALLLQEIVNTKKHPSTENDRNYYYNFSGSTREVIIDPNALKRIALMPHSVHIQLGSLSPASVDSLEKTIETIPHNKKITHVACNEAEYKQFHRRNTRSGIHEAVDLEKPVTTITFLDKNGDWGAQLKYATVDDFITCTCE